MRTLESSRRTARYRFAAALLLALLAPAAQALGEDSGMEWTLAKSADGVEVYNRDVPGSAFKELRANALVPAPLREVVAWYQDPSTYPEWIDRCAEARRVETGQGVGANYLRFDFPFPASDRDVVLRARTQVETANEVIFDVENVDGLVPETSGVVRIPLLVARWEFRSHGDGATEVVYRQRMEAGGRLPAFIVNRSSVDSPYGTLVGLARYATQRRSR